MIPGWLLKLIPFGGQLAKRWWRTRDLARNLDRAVVGAIEAQRTWPPGVRDELVAQWRGVRDDTQVTQLVRRMIDRRTPDDERRLRARVHRLLTDLDLKLGVDETTGRLVRVIVRNLSEAQAKPEQSHRADITSIEDKLDASAERELEILERLPPREDRSAERIAAALQLPRDVGDFTDRECETAVLVETLSQPGSNGAPLIAVVTGKPGVGKSALAVHAAHALSMVYPDAQLYADLTDASVDDPDVIVTGFLEALGSEQLSTAASERSALFRHMTRGRRLLIVLDGAVAEGQVRPLIPATAGSAVIVTSRAPLSGLEGISQAIDLDILGEADGAAMLATMLQGDPRLPGELDAVHRVARLCGGLPLALRIAGARLRARRTWDIAGFATRLADERRRLDELAAGDREVRASFALSADELTPSALRLFGFVGVLRTPTVDRAIAGALLDVAPEAAASVLEELADAHLLDVVDDERYAIHDLLRLFARERLETGASPDEIAAGVRRMLQAIADRALEAAQIMDSATGEALARFERERPEILGAVELAHEREHWFGTWLVAMAASPLYERAARWDEWQRTHELALDAVGHIDTLPGGADAPDPREMEAQILTRLGQAYLGTGHTERSIDCHRRALAIASERDDREGEGSELQNLGNALGAAGRHREAVSCYERALAIALETENVGLQAAALNGLGTAQFRAGELESAAEALERSLVLKRRSGDRLGEARTLANLGNVTRRAGRWTEARRLYQDSARLYALAGDRYGEARSELDLAGIEADVGERDAARQRLERVLAIQVELGARFQIAVVLLRLSFIARAEHELQAADAYAAESLERFQQVGDAEGEANATNALALIAADRGRLDEAIAYHRANLITFRDLDDRRGRAGTLGNLGAVYALRGEIEAAVGCLRQSVELFCDLHDAHGEAISRNELGRVHADQGDYDEAERQLDHSLRVFRAVGDEPNASEVVRNLINLYADTGRVDRAVELVDESIVSRRDRGDRRGEAEFLVVLGRLLALKGDHETARVIFRQALTIPDALTSGETDEVRRRIWE